MPYVCDILHINIFHYTSLTFMVKGTTFEKIYIHCVYIYIYICNKYMQYICNVLLTCCSITEEQSPGQCYSDVS